MRYIDADKLYDEIMHYRAEAEDSYGRPGDNDFPFGRKTACDDIAEIIDGMLAGQNDEELFGTIHNDCSPANLLVKSDEWDAALAKFENGSRVRVIIVADPAN